MGLRVQIYRSGYNSDRNYFNNVNNLSVMNVDGNIDQPNAQAPAAVLIGNAYGDPIVVPAMWDGTEWVPMKDSNLAGPMMGGGYVDGDSRWRKEVGVYAAVPLHDRFETWDDYNANFD